MKKLITLAVIFTGVALTLSGCFWSKKDADNVVEETYKKVEVRTKEVIEKE